MVPVVYPDQHDGITIINIANFFNILSAKASIVNIIPWTTKKVLSFENDKMSWSTSFDG